MIGKPGAGLCPVRGHSNVQGDRTMGIWEKMPEKFLAALDAHFGINSPRKHGVDTVDAIRAMRDGRAKVFMGMGGNFATATPDTAVTEAALRSCSLTVQVSTKLNRSHVVHGRTALILPSLGRTDRDIQNGVKQQVSVEDSMSMVHLSRGSLHPPIRPGAQRGRHRLPTGAHPARARSPRAVGAVQRRLRHHPRRDRRRGARLRGLQREGACARRFPAAARPTRFTRIPHQHRQSELRGEPAASGCRCRRAG